MGRLSTGGRGLSCSVSCSCLFCTWLGMDPASGDSCEGADWFSHQLGHLGFD